jgi:hypothetical protein
VALTVSHEHVAKSIDMSDVDRHLFGKERCGLEAIRAARSRIRRVVLRQVFLPGRADPDPSGSSRI